MSDTIDFLRRRRSVPPRLVSAPGPDRGDLDLLMEIAARVPDHGKLAPWRFIVAEGAARRRLAERLWDARRADLDGAAAERLEQERLKLADAPTLVVVVSTAGPHDKIPEWEQVLSAGAACMNLVSAALAMGWGASWLTGWAAYDPRARAILGVKDDERVAGIIHLGTVAERAPERPRPALADIVTAWDDRSLAFDERT